MNGLKPIIDMINRLRSRVDGMITRAVVERVNDGLKTQRLQISLLDGDVENDVEHMQPYGLSFTPPAGAEAVALSVGGYRSHTVVLGVSKPGSRPTGNAEPETGGLYNKGEWRVFLNADGEVMIGGDDATEPIPLGTALKTWLDAHVHPTAMGPSGPPSTPLPTTALSTKNKVK